MTFIKIFLLKTFSLKRYGSVVQSVARASTRTNLRVGKNAINAYTGTISAEVALKRAEADMPKMLAEASTQAPLAAAAPAPQQPLHASVAVEAGPDSFAEAAEGNAGTAYRGYVSEADVAETVLNNVPERHISPKRGRQNRDTWDGQEIKQR